MDFKKIKIGDIIKIKEKKYEIIGFMEDAECLPPNYKWRDTLEFDLLEKGSKRITPTHWLVYYLDTKEISFSSRKLKEKDVQVIS